MTPVSIKTYPIVFLVVFFLLRSYGSYSQVYGCTDPNANNYNASATANNGSCTYNTTSYTPPVKVDPISDTLIESSGLQMAGGFLWSLNDGLHPASIYRIDTLTNTIFQTVTLYGATNMDWEEISFDGTYFYIGDFGNNGNGARNDLKIYKFPFSAIPQDYVANPRVIIPAEKIEIINFTYSDQPQPPVATSSNNTKFDCEAFIIDGGKIHLFSKNWIDINTTHYVINGITAGTYVATPVETLASGYLVTAASKAGNGVIALLGYQASGFYNHYMYLLSDYSGGNYFNGNKRRIDMSNVFVMGQAEGITFRNGAYGYISNEQVSALSINQKLRSFDVRNFIPPAFVPALYTFTGNGNWNTSTNWSNNTIPPSSPVGGSEIVIDPTAGGQCILNVPYTLPSNSSFTVKAGKNLVIQGNLIIQ